MNNRTLKGLTTSAIAAAALTGLFVGSASADIGTAGINSPSGILAQAGSHAGVLMDHEGKAECKGHNECKGKGGCKAAE